MPTKSEQTLLFTIYPGKPFKQNTDIIEYKLEPNKTIRSLYYIKIEFSMLSIIPFVAIVFSKKKEESVGDFWIPIKNIS